jgi:anion-transporting  ArsA/GET3 family ATPase
VSPKRSLLHRRLVVVTGKGGTGKTSVAAALALAAAERGQRVAVLETGRDEHLPPLVRPGVGTVGYEGRELREGLHARRIDPYEALAEYLKLQLRVPGVVTRVLRNRSFRQLLDAAPGWRELITLGKVWHMEQAEEEGRRRFDLIVIDAPATGHGLTFLDVPRVVVSAVRTGPLRRHASWVEAMVRDPERTVLLPVALPEELPARETAELVARVRDHVGVAVDRVVVNAMPDAPFPASVPDLDERLARLRLPAGDHGLPPPPVLAACAAHLRSRYELARHYREAIGEWTGLPTCSLPLLAEGVSGPDALRRLAAALLDEALEEAA